MAFGCNTVKTGAFGYFEYDFETSFDTGGCPCMCGKVLGFEQRITGWTWTNNRITLNQLNSIEPKTYAYGQAQGTMSVDFVVSNPWYNSLLFARGACACFPNVCMCVSTYTWRATCDANNKCVESFTAEVGVEAGATDIERIISGAVINNITLRSSIGEAIRGTADIQYATETTACAPTIDTTPASCTVGTAMCQFIPYTFAHGQLQWNCCTVAELQSFDITLNQNAELLWGHNNNHAIDAYRRVFEMTGTFQATHTCITLLNDLYAQIGDNCETKAEEQTQIVLTLNNGCATTAQRQIEYTFTGIGIGDLGTAVEPVEPIFENLTWQARRGAVTAINFNAAEP